MIRTIETLLDKFERGTLTRRQLALSLAALVSNGQAAAQETALIEQGDGSAATVDHYDFWIASFNADEARAKLKARNLKFADGNSQESFKFQDLDGFQVQLNAPDYVGHVS